MLNIPQKKRRSFLKMMAGTPMLPMGAAGILSALSDQSAFAADDGLGFKSAEFISMDAPSLANPEAMATTTVQSLLEITTQNNLKKTYKLAYEPFFMTGDMVSDGNGGKILAGGFVDIHNKPIMDMSLAGKERQLFSDCPDGMSLLKLAKSNASSDSGNTVLVIEHNLDVIKQADWIIDLGPEGGEGGGYIIGQGTPESLITNHDSYTGQFLQSVLNLSSTLSK